MHQESIRLISIAKTLIQLHYQPCPTLAAAMAATCKNNLDFFVGDLLTHLQNELLIILSREPVPDFPLSVEATESFSVINSFHCGGYNEIIQLTKEPQDSMSVTIRVQPTSMPILTQIPSNALS